MRSNTLAMSAWTRALKHPSFVTGFCILLVLLFCAVLSVFWSPYNVAEIDIPNKWAFPCSHHWLGSDSLGRDIASLLWVVSSNAFLGGAFAVGIG